MTTQKCHFHSYALYKYLFTFDYTKKYATTLVHQVEIQTISHTIKKIFKA